MKLSQTDPTLRGWQAQVRAVVFDLGGVIATSMGVALQGLVEAWGTDVARSPERWREVWRPLYTEATLGHLHPDELWRQFRQSIDLGSLPVGLEEVQFLSRIHLREPGIAQTLAQLKKKYTVGLLSNHVGRWARALLERFGLMPFLDAVLISSDNGARKPAAVMYEGICQLLDVMPAQAVYVGDEEEDMIGCQAVGMYPIFIPGQDSASSVGLRIENLSALLRVL